MVIVARSRAERTLWYVSTHRKCGQGATQKLGGAAELSQ
jgi:hypothetical protein